MGLLPPVSDKKALNYEYFPTKWQAIIWRNWGYVPVERIAEVLGTTIEIVKQTAKMMGLDPEQSANPIWEKRGFLTLIRNNWHLCTYEQILTLLNISEETLAFILKEDDFMWCKLGELKPQLVAPKYEPLTEEQRKRTEDIADLFSKRFSEENSQTDNAFEFIDMFEKVSPLESDEELTELNVNKAAGLRMVYPYYALYGDTLIDESLDPFPERLLRQYAETGVNGIWIQGVLYQLVEYPFDKSLSEGWEKRIQSLNRLVQKAKKYGIGVYLYLNEPRAMTELFYKRYPHLQGEQEGEFYALCTSTAEVQNYLYQGMKKLFAMVPELAGYFSITMSENLTNCYSRIFVEERAGLRETVCPRCKKRTPWEVVAEVSNLMAKGAHDSSPTAKAITWTWGWQDEWAEKVVPLLQEGQIIQCTSEEAMKFCIGGVDGCVLDYTMSLCGPGEKAKNVWKVARECGLQTAAKVQINNTWEMAAVPYIPVFDKISEHITNLKKEGIQHIHAGWTLGGCPSPNLKLSAWLLDEKGTALDYLCMWLGEKVGMEVYEAQKKLCEAFSNYPFHLNSLYYGPQNFGPMAPFFIEKTQYQATMVGFPYDDVERWAGIYSTHVYEKQYRLLCEQWKEGVQLLEKHAGYDVELDEVITIAKAILCQCRSAYHHICFVNMRECISDKQQELLDVIHEEMKNLQQLIKLRMKDSRIGFESSNHYFYTLQDLKEKLINLDYCEKRF